MKSRNGQVALYLVAVLVAIAVLVFMNVEVFLAIRAKNHATNAGDAAAIAVAKYQGELLNQVGNANIEQLQAILKNDWQECQKIMEEQRRRIFLDPLEGVRIGCNAANNALCGCESGGGMYPEEFESSRMEKILEDHAFDIRNIYAADKELYPEPWDGAWELYAQKLESVISDQVIAGPENAEYVNAYKCFPLLDQAFYNAVAGEMWCWFKWNGEWLFDRDSHNMPRPVYTPDRKHDNSEIYSLHLDIKELPEVLDQEWTNIIMRLTGCSESDMEQSWLLTNGTQRLAFFDSRWDSWKESGFSMEYGFPIVGDVKPEYDVLGCAALCRVVRVGAEYDPEVDEGVEFIEAKRYEWTAAAKPFGTVENLDGDVDVVTCLKSLVTPAFTDVRLVPVDSVGGKDLHTADYDWMVHIRDHLPEYFTNGPPRNGCWYCQQLATWENSEFRERGRRWLQYHSSECVRPRPGNCNDHGGTAHAH